MSENTTESVSVPDAPVAPVALALSSADSSTPATVEDLRQTALAALQRVFEIVKKELDGLPIHSGQEALGQARSILAVCHHALEQGVERI